MLAALPVPHDIPLPMPIDRVVAEGLLVALFIAHILFVALMVGGSILSLVYEFMGLKKRDYDVLAHEIASTVTVNKSLAVVLGVGPLLGINVLYTIYFYSANALTGTAWIMMVPLITAAFLITYAHKYSWEKLADAKGLHLSIGLLGTLLFLLIPLIFLANINLMLFPERWSEVRGFLSALALPNVLPRYFHFLVASILITALFGVVWFTRKSFPVEERFAELDRAALRRQFYGIALAAVGAQFVFGPLVLFTLPSDGLGWFMILVILAGAVLAVVAALMLWREMLTAPHTVGGRYVTIIALVVTVGMCMGYGRHLYRENAVDEHRAKMMAATDNYELASEAVHWRQLAGIGLIKLPPGEKRYVETCSGCHLVDKASAGPALTEIYELYGQDPQGVEKMVAWAKKPGRKRTNMIAMPAFGYLPESELRATSEYMLELAVAPVSENGTGESETQPAVDTSEGAKQGAEERAEQPLSASEMKTD